MTNSAVVSGLRAKRGELVVQAEHHRRELARLAQELGHLEATIRLFDPGYEVSRLHRRGRAPVSSGSGLASASVSSWRPCGMPRSRCRTAPYRRR